MTLPCPHLGELLVTVDHDDGSEVLLRYSVSLAEFNTYTRDSEHWVCIRAEADRLINSPKMDYWVDAQPWLEMRVPVAGIAAMEMIPGRSFRCEAYRESDSRWLTNFYQYAHGGIDDATATVVSAEGDTAILEVTGDSDDAGPFRLKAEFQLNPRRYAE